MFWWWRFLFLVLAVKAGRDHSVASTAVGSRRPEPSQGVIRVAQLPLRKVRRERGIVSEKVRDVDRSF